MLYVFLPDVLAFVLVLLSRRKSTRIAQRRQAQRILVAVQDEVGLISPSSKRPDPYVKEAAEDIIFRELILASERNKNIASGTISGGNLIAIGFQSQIWWGGIFVFLYLAFFAGSVILWQEADVESVIEIERRQTILSVGYIATAIVAKLLLWQFA